MLRQRNLLALLAVAALSFSQPVVAGGDLTRQKPIEINVNLGNGDGDLVFEPANLTFETGRLYKLILSNPSDKKHYFTSPGLANKVFTRKVEVLANGKRIAEIKGSIREIEVFPGGQSEWWFVPVATGTLADLHCHVKDDDGKTHAEKGMVGTIVIK